MTKLKKARKNVRNLAKASRSLVKNIYRAMKIHWKINRTTFLITFIPLTIVSILPFGVSLLYARLIDSFVSFLSGEDLDKEYILTILALNLSLSLVIELLWKLVDLGEKLTFQRWHVYSSAAVNEAMSKLDLEVYESHKFNKFINKVREGFEWKPADYMMQVIWGTHQVVELISSIVFMITLSPFLIPILLIALLPGFAINLKASKQQWAVWDLKAKDRTNYYNTVGYLNREENIKELRIFGTRNYLVGLLKKVLGDFIETQNKVIKREAKQTIFAQVLEFAVTAGINIWLALKILSRNGFGIGDYTFFISTIERFSTSSRHLLRNISRLYDRDLYMQEFFKLLDMEPTIKVKENAVKIGTEKVPLIEFKNVTFGYPGSKEKIFKNFSLKINPGEDIALVGENGAGKTTFVKLLARFYDVNKGKILINGHDIRDIDLDSWHKNMGVLFQDFNKYAYSVRDNIALGKLENFKDINGIIEAGKESGAHSFVDSYDKKYNKVLSKQFNNGIEPSGGQWQKIALARAFFRNANILILDEPTSAIDAKAEYEIFKKIAEVQAEKTTIIISHRFSTVKKAHKIYVIDKGQIIEDGTHKDLMKIKDGKYKEMFELQAEGYKS